MGPTKWGPPVGPSSSPRKVPNIWGLVCHGIPWLPYFLAELLWCWALGPPTLWEPLPLWYFNSTFSLLCPGIKDYLEDKHSQMNEDKYTSTCQRTWGVRTSLQIYEQLQLWYLHFLVWCEFSSVPWWIMSSLQTQTQGHVSPKVCCLFRDQTSI